MHHLSPMPRREGMIKCRSSGCQDLVRFFALLRIKPHAPPLVRVPVNSFEFHYCVSCGTDGHCPPTPSIHRLQRGLPGYLILFAPHAFEPQRQSSSSKPPSPPVFLLISTHFTATLGIPLTSPILELRSFQCSSGVEPRDFTSDLRCRLRSLYTQ